MEIESTQDKKTVSLVLGSGGARGLAHIGVIRWLEANNYDIASISGCSIGALVGGIYAAGKLDDFEQWVRSITRMDMVTLLDLSWGNKGLVKGEKIIRTLVNLVGEKCIEDLPIPFTAVAADVKKEKEIWIQSGCLFDAIRASISLPLIFTPFPYNGVDLIDGGVLNPVPIAPTFGDQTDMTIAVNLGGPVELLIKEPEPLPQDNGDESPMKSTINRFVNRLKRSVKTSGVQDWSVYDIANQAFDAMQSTIARQKLAAYPPDKIIEIPRNACGMLEFDRAEAMIDLGFNKAQAILG
ncbi:MAG: patatin-like phospholipase family protein [Proteobacteria bacterium]|nr:patatin-like phospholipase family protein [Pseudomonadota bacterium]